MHWVNRGPEPSGLESVRLQFTQEWVAHRQSGTGGRPSPRWRPFRPDLSSVFSGLCGYCEEITRGEIDHFKPASQFPALVYQWSNWILACHDCNHAKSNKWPEDGYINPCAAVASERPERFFDFDTETGYLRPKVGIPAAASAQARRMIDDIRLNAPHHIMRRKERMLFVKRHLSSLEEDSAEGLEFLERITARSFSLSSITRAILEQSGFVIED